MEKYENKNIIHGNDISNAKQLLGKWDKILADYENYVKEYLKNYKKSLKGCRLSLTKYPYMKEKSDALMNRLNRADKKGLLTTRQLARIFKVKRTTLKVCNDQKKN